MQNWQQVRSAFQEIWGYEDFRPPQGEVVQSLLAGQDTLVVMPTGGGKSICFQLPALLQTGITLVISPLVALMENQVQELRERQLNAALLHSQLSLSQRKRTLTALERQNLRLLYLSPETLLSPPVWERLCQQTLKINGLILDEAHCLVQWGDTFRPAYRRLGTVRSVLLEQKSGQIPIAAFTATADSHAQKVICQTLQLKQPQTFLLSPYRDNLHLRVQMVWTPRQRQQKLRQFILTQGKETGLVYARSRQDCETLSRWLQAAGYRTQAYHAGLGAAQRREIEQQWLQSHLQFVVCTSAFGMGINKSDCRWIIHYQAPLFLSEYIQEVGRGGRDGKPVQALTLMAECTGLLYPDDKQRQQYFLQQLQKQQQYAQQIAKKIPPKGEVNTVARQFKNGAIALSLLHSTGQLKYSDPFHYIKKSNPVPQVHKTQPLPHKLMQQYLHTRQCRWQFLLAAFGFSQDAAGFHCGHCDNCKG
jgi:ATP-dependent DNA helicase RecQ